MINVVPGAAETGAALVADPMIDKISFTGSTAIGSVIARQAASAKTGPKPCTMELGGKAPMIVCDDADLEKAVEDVVGAAFCMYDLKKQFLNKFSNVTESPTFDSTANAGQNCCAGTRLYLQAGVHDEFLRLLKEKVEGLVVGDHLDDKTEMGPLGALVYLRPIHVIKRLTAELIKVSEDQMHKVLDHIEIAKNKNVGTLLTGGHRLGETGYFVAPTGWCNCHLPKVVLE